MKKLLTTHDDDGQRSQPSNKNSPGVCVRERERERERERVRERMGTSIVLSCWHIKGISCSVLNVCYYYKMKKKKKKEKERRDYQMYSLKSNHP